MARDFKGKNKLNNAYDLFYWRQKYDIEAYEQQDGPPCAMDLHFGEMQHYAQFDLEGNPIIPNEAAMVSMKNPSSHTPIKVFNFVADMFIDLRTHFELALASGHLCRDNPIFNDLKITTGYIPPIAAYKTYLNNLLSVFILNEIPKTYGYNNIMDFESFVKKFFHYNEHKRLGEPITFTGWLISKNSSIFNTGLGLQIADMETGNDQDIVDRLIDRTQFPYYSRLLTNLGFGFDFKNPSIILADLGSPAIKKYYNKFNIESISSLFNRYYTKSYYKDIDILIDRLIHFYNIFVTTNQREVEFSLCKKRTRWDFVYRTEITESEAMSIFPISYWIAIQPRLRNIENKNKIDAATIKRIQKYAVKIEKLFDKEQAMDYINNETKTLFFERDHGFKFLLKQMDEYLKSVEKDKGKSVFSGGGY